jgi:hypothetical protein
MASSVSETPEYQAVLSSTLFIASSTTTSLALLTSLRALISNPAGSGKIGLIYQLDIFATAPGCSAQLFIDPVSNLPTTVRPSMNANVDGNNTGSVLVFKADNGSAMAAGTTGTDTKIYIPLGTSFRESIELPPFIIRPGHALGINIPVLVAASVAVNARWMEYNGT